MVLVMALDGMSSLIRNMIGQENIDQVMLAFEQIRSAAVSMNGAVVTILQNQQIAERNAQARHAQLLDLFDQMGVRPIPDAAATPERPAITNGKGP
jgi:hypothetical protein